MDIPVVDALLGAFGPFVIPVVVFAAGAVGYGVLLLAGRLLSADGSNVWRADSPETGEEAADPDRHQG